MNSLTLRAVLAELTPFFRLRLVAVVAPDPWTLHLVLERDTTLVVCVAPARGALFPAPSSTVSTEGTTAFAKSVSESLVGGRLVAARQAGLDRVCALTFERRDRLGDASFKHLIAEFTGAGSNLVVVDGAEPWSGRVIDRLREDRSRNNTRTLTLGKPYHAPEGGGADATRVDASALVTALTSALPDAPSLPRAIASAWTGTGPGVSDEIIAGAGSTEPAALAVAWRELLRDTQPGRGAEPAGARLHPGIARSPSGKAHALCFEPTGEAEFTPTASASAALALTFREAAASNAPGGGPPNLTRAVRAAQKRVRRALEAVKSDREEASAGEDFRKIAEALLASANTVSKGASTATIPDPHGGEPLSVELDPTRSVTENAERYFKRARKAHRGGTRIAEREAELMQQSQALDGLLSDARDAGPEGPDARWMERARKLGVRVPKLETDDDKPKRYEDTLESALRPRTYDLGDGWEALVGKSNKGNEVLTHRIARPGDTWMHVDHSPGSHVVLRHHEKGKEPPKEKVLAAAAIAAFYSKSRNAGKVSVLITTKRHVRKPSKAPVGTVTVGRHTTVMVRPEDPDDRGRT